MRADRMHVAPIKRSRTSAPCSEFFERPATEAKRRALRAIVFGLCFCELAAAMPSHGPAGRGHCNLWMGRDVALLTLLPFLPNLPCPCPCPSLPPSLPPASPLGAAGPQEVWHRHLWLRRRLRAGLLPRLLVSSASCADVPACWSGHGKLCLRGTVACRGGSYSQACQCSPCLDMEIGAIPPPSHPPPLTQLQHGRPDGVRRRGGGRGGGEGGGALARPALPAGPGLLWRPCS